MNSVFQSADKRLFSYLLPLLLLMFSVKAQAGVDLDLIPASDSNRLWGFVDGKSRQTVIPAQFYKVGFFYDGAAIITLKQVDSGRNSYTYGLIGKDGRYILEPVYSRIEQAVVKSNREMAIPGLYVVENESGKGIFDLGRGMVVEPGQYAAVRDRIYFEDIGHIRIGDYHILGEGAFKPPSGYEIVEILKDEQAFIVSRRGSFDMSKRGLMDVDGKFIIRADYDSLQPYGKPVQRWLGTRIDSAVVGSSVSALFSGRSNGIDLGNENDIMTIDLMDEKGRRIRQYRSRFEPDIRGDRVSFISGGSYHQIDPMTGDMVEADPLGDKGKRFVRFEINELMGLKDLDGAVVLEPTYGHIEPLGGSLYALKKAVFYDENTGQHHYLHAHTGLYDAASRRLLLPHDYSEIRCLNYPDQENCLLHVKKSSGVYSNGYGIADRSGKIIVEPTYDMAFHMNAAGQSRVFKNDRIGVVDASGKFIVPLIYENVRDDSRNKGHAVNYFVQKEGKWGLYNANGKLIVPVIFNTLMLDPAAFERGWVSGYTVSGLNAFNYRTGQKIQLCYSSLSFYPHFILAFTAIKSEYDLLDYRGKAFLKGFTEVKPLKSGNFMFKKNDKLGLLDAKGKVITKVEGSYLEAAEPGFVWVHARGERQYLMSEKGEPYRIGQ